MAHVANDVSIDCSYRVDLSPRIRCCQCATGVRETNKMRAHVTGGAEKHRQSKAEIRVRCSIVYASNKVI